MSTLWPELNFDQEPRLIVGNRKSSGLIDCYRVNIHESTFMEFRKIAENTISRLSNMNSRRYDYFGALEEDEYFILDNSTVPRRPLRRTQAQRQQGQPGTEEIASVLAIVAETDIHPTLSSDELRSAKMNFYMISYPIDPSYLGFIRQTSPKRSISPGKLFTMYGATLKKIERPDFVFDNRVDLIVGHDNTIILSDNVVQMLFRDVKLVMQSVTENITELANKFQKNLPFTVEGTKLLHDFCNKGPRNAKRLYDLVVGGRLNNLDLDPANITDTLSRHGLDHLLSNGELNLTDESIPSFFDYIEGRLYHDDHTHNPRRADRYSIRISQG